MELASSHVDVGHIKERPFLSLDEALTMSAAHETAEAQRVSCETVLREWKLAKVWLLLELSRENKDGR